MALRITMDEALEQATRRRIHDAILAQPGVRMGTIAARLGLDYKTVAWHVRVLKGLGFVDEQGPGQRHLFVRDRHLGRAERAAAMALTSPLARSLWGLLAKEPRLDFREATRLLGASKAGVSQAASRLAEAGLVEKRRVDGRLVLAACLSQGRPSSAPGGPSFAMQAPLALA